MHLVIKVATKIETSLHIEGIADLNYSWNDEYVEVVCIINVFS
jgi:hypothetical protein